MGHSVQLIIGRDAAMARLAAAWPQAKPVELAGGWSALAVNDVLYDAVAAAWPDGRKDDTFDSAPPGLMEALEAATAEGGRLAYVETDYFGGTGSQSAAAWIDGEMMAASRSRGIGAINGALRVIGVVDAAGKDAFDTIGLGERRTMGDYEVAPRGVEAAGAPPVAPAQGLPIWIVAVAVALAIAGGIVLAMMPG